MFAPETKSEGKKSQYFIYSSRLADSTTKVNAGSYKLFQG